LLEWQRHRSTLLDIIVLYPKDPNCKRYN